MLVFNDQSFNATLTNGITGVLGMIAMYMHLFPVVLILVDRFYNLQGCLSPHVQQHVVKSKL